MTLKVCPQCGIDLSSVWAGHSMEIFSQNTQFQSSKQPANDAKPDDAAETDSDAANVQRVREVICALNRKYYSPRPRTLRPDLSDESVLSPESHTSQTLTRVANKMHRGIRLAGEQSVDALLESVRQTLNQDNPFFPRGLGRVLQAVGAILYDQEWTGDLDKNEVQGMDDSEDGIKPLADCPKSVVPLAAMDVFELMLLIDYGFPDYPLGRSSILPYHITYEIGTSYFNNFSSFLASTARRWKQGHIPSPETWEYIADRTSLFEIVPVSPPVDMWDAATMMYYYHSHRKPITLEAQRQGWTGYTGVLQEMVAEIPSRGVDRLARKLSLDVHILLPRCVGGRQKRAELISIANHIAAQHGVELKRPESRKGWLDGLAGFFSFMAGAEKEKKA